MSLSYAGKPLARDDRTLEDYSVGNLARLTWNQPVGKRPPSKSSLLCLQIPPTGRRSRRIASTRSSSDTIGTSHVCPRQKGRLHLFAPVSRLGVPTATRSIFLDPAGTRCRRLVALSRRRRLQVTDSPRTLCGVLSYSELRTLAAGACVRASTPFHGSHEPVLGVPDLHDRRRVQPIRRRGSVRVAGRLFDARRRLSRSRGLLRRVLARAHG